MLCPTVISTPSVPRPWPCCDSNPSSISPSPKKPCICYPTTRLCRPGPSLPISRYAGSSTSKPATGPSIKPSTSSNPPRYSNSLQASPSEVSIVPCASPSTTSIQTSPNSSPPRPDSCPCSSNNYPIPSPARSTSRPSTHSTPMRSITS